MVPESASPRWQSRRKKGLALGPGEHHEAPVPGHREDAKNSPTELGDFPVFHIPVFLCLCPADSERVSQFPPWLG